MQMSWIFVLSGRKAGKHFVEVFAKIFYSDYVFTYILLLHIKVSIRVGDGKKN